MRIGWVLFAFAACGKAHAVLDFSDSRLTSSEPRPIGGDARVAQQLDATATDGDEFCCSELSADGDPELGKLIPIGLDHTVQLGNPTASRDVDKAIIRRYIKRNLQELTACYVKQLATKPNLRGSLQTSFLIAQNGRVQEAQAAGVDGDVSSCVAEVVRTIVFPEPNGGSVHINYPFVFR